MFYRIALEVSIDVKETCFIAFFINLYSGIELREGSSNDSFIFENFNLDLKDRLNAFPDLLFSFIFKFDKNKKIKFINSSLLLFIILI